MIRKLFPIFVAMVVVLAFGSVHAQTTVKIAFIDTVIVDPGLRIVATGGTITGVPDQIATDSACWDLFGFAPQSEFFVAVRLPGTSGPQFLAGFGSAPIPPGTRLEIGAFVASCDAGGADYDIYDANVSATPATFVAVFNTVPLEIGTRIVATGMPGVPSIATASISCWANLGFPSLVPGTRVVHMAGPGSTSLIDVWGSNPIAPGSRLEITAYASSCSADGDTYDIYIADVVSPTQGGALLVAAPAGVSLESNSESVAKSDSDSDGISNFVCITPGSGAEHTELWCDIPIERGDRIVGFHSPLVDPDTGITYWWAELEY